MDIQAKCKRCGRMARADEFVLDYVYKVMVCPNCVKERKIAERKKEHDEKKILIREEEKAPGWDKEDEYLERVHMERQAMAGSAEKIDDERVRYHCQKCGYNFLYNFIKKTPPKCPYCGREVDYE